jgi:hypothetical protein
MPTARELLEQADALMRRNRARAVDTEIPELTEVISFPGAPALPAAAPAAPIAEPVVPSNALDDIPELTDAVEEIEISSIAEMPGDDEETSAWLRSDRGDATDIETAETSEAFESPAAPEVSATEAVGGRVLPLFVLPAKPEEGPAADVVSESALSTDTDAVVAENLGATAKVVELPSRDGPPREADPLAATAISPAPADDEHGMARPAVERLRSDDWARWEALAEEIRMQVLQRIDIFTDTGLREQLSTQLQPIVDRASAEMVATVNEQVGKLLRAYIAQAIEREIETWRKGSG